MSEQTNQDAGREYTDAELQAMRDKTLKFYAQQTKMLTAQCQVEELRARINKAKYESLEYTLRFMQLDSSLKEQPEEEETDKEETKSE